MTPDTAQDVVPSRIADLLSERATLLAWLERVEERRDDVRPAVYERVRDDYRERLDEVEGSLASHRSDLEESLARHRSALEELEEEREERAARLEEAELRHAVGELDDKAWEEREGALRSELDDLEERLGEEREASSRLEEVLEELEGVEDRPSVGTHPPRSSAEPTAPAREEDEGADVEEPEAAGEPSGPAPEREPSRPERSGPARENDEEDELDFLESLAWEEEGLDTLSLMLDEEEEEGEEPRDGDAG